MIRGDDDDASAACVRGILLNGRTVREMDARIRGGSCDDDGRTDALTDGAIILKNRAGRRCEDRRVFERRRKSLR